MHMILAKVWVALLDLPMLNYFAGMVATTAVHTLIPQSRGMYALHTGLFGEIGPFHFIKRYLSASPPAV